MTSDNITVPQGQIIERILTLELVRVTERAAVAAARLRGHGNEKAADQAAVDGMRRQLNMLDIKGVVVIGEGERDEAPMLFIGEEVGTGQGPAVDIALDPLEGTTLTARDMPNALAVVAMAPRGTLLHAPDVHPTPEQDRLAHVPRSPAARPHPTPTVRPGNPGQPVGGGRKAGVGAARATSLKAGACVTARARWASEP